MSTWVLSFNVFSSPPPGSCQDAFSFSQSSERLWLLHYCSILHCNTHGSICAAYNSGTIHEDRITQCTGVGCLLRDIKASPFNNLYRVKGRPHYYSPKKEEYAHIKFDLDAGSSAPPQPPITHQALTMHRLHLSFQLEYEAVVCLGCCNLPISRRVLFIPGSHLGLHHQLPEPVASFQPTTIIYQITFPYKVQQS